MVWTGRRSISPLDANYRRDPNKGQTMQPGTYVDACPGQPVARRGCCTWLLYTATGASTRWSASVRRHAFQVCATGSATVDRVCDLRCLSVMVCTERLRMRPHCAPVASSVHHHDDQPRRSLSSALDLQIRRNGHIVEDRPSLALCWADVPQLSAITQLSSGESLACRSAYSQLTPKIGHRGR